MKMKSFYLVLLIANIISCQHSEPNNSDVQNLLDEGRYERAASTILEMKAEKVDELTLIRAALLFTEKVESEKAISILEKLLEAYPDNTTGKLLMANNLRNSNQDDNRALKLYFELMEIDSIRFMVLPERARLYVKLQEFDKAKQDIAEGKKIQPKYFANYLADGLLQFSQGRQQEALDLFEICNDYDPGVSSEASLNAGFILLRNNLNYDAMGQFSKAIERGKYINKGYAFINRGICQINLQDTSFACTDWDSAYKYMPVEAKKYIDLYCPEEQQ